MTKPPLVFIGRQYHRKTQSDQTILNLLEKHFTLHLLRREQYSDQELVQAVNAHQPKVVFFWCLPPSSTKHLWKIKCKNVVWAPMWDGFRPLGFRKKWLLERSKVKVLCFSRALYRYFSKSKMRTLPVQCALKPDWTTFKDQGPYTLFFWQRQKKIGLDQMVQFFGEKNIAKVLYKSEIGNQLQKDYPFQVVTLPDWLESEEYTKLVKSCDFYVAPRLSEGIGFSFLEALRYGKVLLGYNESTMNEYIEEGVNGYLFDQDFKPIEHLQSPLELSEKLKEKAQTLYDRWQKQKEQIIDFTLME